MAAVREAVQGGPDQPFAAEYLRPVFERKIRGHYQALSLIDHAVECSKQDVPSLEQ